MTRRRRLAARIGLTLAVLGGLYLSRAGLFRAAAAALDVSEPPRPATAAYVLGGGSDDRPCVAAALYRAGLVGRVIQPGVGLSVDDPAAEDDVRPPETVVTRRVLLARGVPAEAVVTLPGEVRSTADEAKALAEYLAGRPGETVAVVTTAFHTRRARVLFRRALGAEAGRVFFVAAPSGRYTAADWWQSEDGFVAYSTEYLKLALAGGW
jgi:uncharacterized SAM-binding protein YcdF (DUF218 family)